MSNLILQTDSYKLTHFKQYPPKTTRVYSYLESRGGMFPETTFFGLQYYLKKYLAGKVFTARDIEHAKDFALAHFGRGDCFNYTGWYDLLNKHGGTLPIRIKAVPEGMTVPNKNVLMTIENTDGEFPWLTNFLETILLKVWYPITVATLSRQIKKAITEYHDITGSDKSGINFKLHDFGYRGVSSEETSGLGGAAHLINFFGSDTLAGIVLAQEYYDAGMAGFSIPAAEHSTITSWGKEHEVDAFKNMLDQWPNGLVAVVSDSYDLENAVRNLWGDKLRDQIMMREGCLIIRPDSGAPATTVVQVLTGLGDRFGYSINQAGFKVLNPKVKVIQGDGINYDSIREILQLMTLKGWAAENTAFGMGGALLQQLNRDTQQFAIKCSAVTVNGLNVDVFKSPTGDKSKASKRGNLKLVRTNGELQTIQMASPLERRHDLLQTVFQDGEIIPTDNSFESIRKRAAL